MVIICFATVLGFIAFVFTAALTSATGGSPLSGGFLTGGITFVAAILLLLRDQRQYRSAIRRVREQLLVRQDRIPETNASADSLFLELTMEAMAGYFDVPLNKIYPEDNLARQYHWHRLEPVIQNAVFCHILSHFQDHQENSLLDSKDVTTVQELSEAFARMFSLPEQQDGLRQPGV